jgi:outer membrane lipoprotein-sorting protein
MPWAKTQASLPKGTKPPAVSLTAAQAIAPYEAFLEATITLQTPIVQTNPNGSRINGRLYIQKPGRARVVYDNGATLLADGKTLECYDPKNRSSDKIALEDTPLDFILRPGKLTKVVNVAKIHISTGTTRISVRSKHDPDAGEITLTFATARGKPTALLSWSIVEPDGKRTHVALSGSKLAGSGRNVPIAPSIFSQKAR